jgi:hypothetical protein
MTKTCRVRISADDHDRLRQHLFRKDRNEHGAVLLAGLSTIVDDIYFSVREVHLANDGTDYIQGKIGHRALRPQFIYRLITRARDQRLAYFAVHNHFTKSSAAFSGVDLRSHELGYPALLQIADGMPVGALVFGRLAAEADLWMPDYRRLSLEKLSIVGDAILELTSRPDAVDDGIVSEIHDRQVKLFGKGGQARLRRAKVGIVGLGGVGSIVAEYLSRLGVGNFVVIDDDVVETSNLSRIVGSSRCDAVSGTSKASVITRLILQANEGAHIEVVVDDVAKNSVARSLIGCDYVFLAADSMRSRLVVNAIVHQYLIPGVQLGAKVCSDYSGKLLDVMSVNRRLRPGQGCLWCNGFIERTQLALESESDQKRKEQAYGVSEPNPSVITLNAVAAAHGVNDFLFDFLGLRESAAVRYEHFHFLRRTQMKVEPRQETSCSECSKTGARYGRGDGVELPCLEG